MRAMVWFRNDLRTGDNPALAAATREADRGVVGVFVACPAQWRVHDWGDPKAGFVLKQVGALAGELERLGIPLRFVCVARFGDVPEALARLATDLGCDAVYWNRELEVNEVRRDAGVRMRLSEAGIGAREFDDQTILAPGSVMTDEGRWYTVFTPFKKKLIGVLDQEGGLGKPAAPKRQPEMLFASDEIPTAVGGFGAWPGLGRWPAGARDATDRLEAFASGGLADYRERRDAPGLEGTSMLSAYLACGTVSVRDCVRRAMRQAGAGTLGQIPADSGAGIWISELIWREFFRHLIVAFPRLCMGRNFQRQYDRLPWREDDAAFGAWREGRTGVPIVDAAMRQLAQTGWMHNRCRMIVAMFLTKNLLLDWRLGERHFMQSLVDGDLASNNGGWQWAASTGTDAAPYFRVFNPVSQSVKFDPGGAYIRRWVPELSGVEDGAVHDPPPLARSRFGYPEAIVDLKASRARAIGVFKACR
ncbi:MAG: deoxyribodipyrimidine photo-lyase [Phycisphaerales bacterium]|nr:deoxyribodipyrimidine photo-lyase [Phycisphaerales bacterium]